MRCAVHPWMNASIHVLDHPYFVLTGADGSFELQGLPPGEYEVTVFHELWKLQPTPVKVIVSIELGQTKAITFTYQPKRKSNQALLEKSQS